MAASTFDIAHKPRKEVCRWLNLKHTYRFAGIYVHLKEWVVLTRVCELSRVVQVSVL